VSARVVDVSDADAVEAAAKALLLEHSAVDVLVSNAGVVCGKDVDALTPADLQRTFGVNTLASFYLLRSLLPAMKAQRRGSVVLVGSIMGLLGSARLTDYCASKWALLGLAESLRLELARDGLGAAIPVSAVCPYAVATGMFEGIFRDPRDWNPLRSLLFPQLRAADVAAVVMRCVASRRSHVVTLPWHALPILYFGKLLLPLTWMDALFGWFGGWHGMSTFRGNTNSSRGTAEDASRKGRHA
jgi:all-trans-retinol dehydrogenase (NAD+)